MKKTLLLIFSAIIFLCIPNIVNASYDAIVTGSSVRIRQEANTNGKILITVSKGSELTVVDKTQYSGSGYKWYKVIYKDYTGYMCSDYIKFVTNSFDGINTSDWTARVNANNVSVRKSADVNSTSLNTLTLGANVTILQEVSGKSTNCADGKWYRINYYGNNQGYMCKQYVTKKSDIIDTDSAYAETLKKEGFPDSYIPFLTKIHKKYPTWIFKAGKTNLNFSSSVTAENNKNYMQTTNDNYRVSSTPSEASSWFTVNSGVIAFYMDPRNWLTEERIFMFEKLDYSSELDSIYPSLIKSIFNGGKLSDDKYTIPMFNAGKNTLISPVHIASRIRQEVGINGSDSINGTKFTFKGKEYEGYYNFFNIGAHEETIDGVKYNSIVRGLAYAAKLISRSGEVWDNIETSITEGASFLANGYINKGQGTLYYQKFNVGPNAYYNTYTHQYQTNIQAPATEGNSTYNSYKKANVLNETFIFEIPIFNNMPQYVSLPGAGNNNNYLSSITIDNYTLSPTFDKDILTYETYVTKDTNKITINAKPEMESSKIEGIGTIDLQTDKTDIAIIVTAENMEKRTYTITINKVSEETKIVKVEDIIKNTQGTIKNDILINIKNGTKISDYKNLLIKNGATTVKVTDSKGTQISETSNLSTSNKITITTPSETKTFTISVKGDTSGDGQITILDLLQVQKHILKSSNLTNERFYAAETSGDGQITILDLLQVQKHIKGDKKL